MKQCPECGKFVSDSAKFCENCGYVFGNASTNDYTASTNDQFAKIDSNSKKENDRRTKYGIILLVAFLFAGYLAYNEFGSQKHRDQSFSEKLIGVWKAEDEEKDKDENMKIFFNFMEADPASTNGTLTIKTLIYENITTENGPPISGTFIITENGSWNIKDGQIVISGAPETRKVSTAGFNYNIVSANYIHDLTETIKSKKFSGGLLNGSGTFKIESVGDDELSISDNDRHIELKKFSLQEFNQVQSEDNSSAMQFEQAAIKAQEARQKAEQKSRIINTWRKRFVGCSYKEITSEATDYFNTIYFGIPDSDGTGTGLIVCEDNETAFAYAIADANNVNCRLKNGKNFALQYTASGILLDNYQVSHERDLDGYNLYFVH